MHNPSRHLRLLIRTQSWVGGSNGGARVKCEARSDEDCELHCLEDLDRSCSIDGPRQLRGF